jgi:hypothetical protein
MLTNYTTYNDIRSILGVSDQELSDATLGLEVYKSYLDSELDEVDSTLITEYAAVVAVLEASRTAAQKRFYRTTRLFAVYAVARQLTTALPLFSPKDISDGKASLARFSDSPYREVTKKVTSEYDRLKTALLDAFYGLTSSTATSTARVYFSSAILVPDPVTGE